MRKFPITWYTRLPLKKIKSDLCQARDFSVKSPDCPPTTAKSDCSKKDSAKGGKGGKKDDAAKTPKRPPDPRTFKVYRFGGILSKEKPRMQAFHIDVSKIGGMVLDALLKGKDMDPTLAFRRSCREGICGSCAICFNGHNCLACITPIPSNKTMTIAPIPHMYVIRDLVVDMTHFFNGYNSIRPYLVRKKSIPMGTNQYAQSLEDSKKMIGLYECVLCACCSTSCPSYWWNGRRFLGPASLLHAFRWVIDSRDGDTANRLEALKDDFKLYRCHTIMNCSLACPKGLNPSIPIAKLKRMVAKLDKKPRSEKDPMQFVGSGSGGKCSC